MGQRTRAWFVASMLALLSGCGALLGISGDDPEETTRPLEDASLADLTNADGASFPSDGAPADTGSTPDADGGGCIDTSSDPNNCGACGRRCNLDGGCEAGVCDRRVVFVTGGTYQGGSFQGTNADQLCTNIANDAGIAGTFRVWLTHPSQPARFATVVKKPYYSSTGALVANEWPPGATISTSIDTDQNGASVGQAFAWSNLTGAGALVGQSDNCLGWGSSAANQQGTFGVTNRTDGEWTQGTDPNNGGSTVVSCSSARHLYCVEYP